MYDIIEIRILNYIIDYGVHYIILIWSTSTRISYVYLHMLINNGGVNLYKLNDLLQYCTLIAGSVHLWIVHGYHEWRPVIITTLHRNIISKSFFIWFFSYRLFVIVVGRDRCMLVDLGVGGAHGPQRCLLDRELVERSEYLS